jgi:hypothetical protein
LGVGVGVRMFSGLVKDHIILIIKNITYKKARFERGHLNDLINEVARLVCDKQQTSDRAMVIIQTALFFACSTGQVIYSPRTRYLTNATRKLKSHGLVNILISIE